MATPIDTEKLPPSGNPAKLPALPSPDTAATRDFLKAVKEILDVREGRRGSSYEKSVTWRDLHDLGLITRVAGQQGGNISGTGLNSDISALPVKLVSRLEQALRNTPLFKSLLAKIGSIDDLEGYPDALRQLLQTSLLEEATQRRAAIQTVEKTLQDGLSSQAQRVTEITAAVEGAQSGIRHVDFTYAEKTRALATSITQVSARLDNAGGDGVTVEEKLTAQADAITGLQGQYTVKIDANGKIAGFGLAVDAPTEGEATSAFIINADKFGIFTSDGDVMPFGVDASGVYINGALRVNAGGQTLDQLGAGAKLLAIIASSQVFQINKAGANTPASISFTANSQNLTGSPTFSVTAGTATLTGTGASRTLAFADMATDSVTVQVAQDGLTDTITVVKVREGADGNPGADAIVMVLSNEAHVLAADSSGTVLSYAGASTTVTVYKGIINDTANWTITKADTNCASSLSGTTITVNPLSADTGYVDITATRSGYPTQTKRFSLSKSKTGQQGSTGTGTPGQRGTVQIQVSGRTSWDDTVASNAISSAGYGSPQNRDMVTQYGTGFSETRYYSSGSWLTVGAYINGNLIVGGEISGVSINIGSGQLQVTTSGVVNAYNFLGHSSTFGNLANPNAPPITATTYAFSSQPAIKATAGIGHAIEAYGSIYCNSTIYASSFSGTISGSNVSGAVSNATFAGTAGLLQPSSGNAQMVAGGMSAYLQPGDGNFIVAKNGTPFWGSQQTGGNMSDRKLKEAIVPTAVKGLDTINALQVVDFRWKAGGPFEDGKTYTGFIAQDAEIVEPRLVGKLEDGTYTMSKETLVPFAIKAIQELHAELQQVKAELAVLKTPL
jgi:hypothetical protein